ncbi:MAG: hypothetical protein HOE30_19780, partial [Deltaproteobacteria bacterium]|nr:hypothetical protein [Deltaproteobacteria bacterium]
MAYTELDMDISPELKAMKKEIGNFARKVMRPAGIELDKLQNPEDVYAKDSVLWDVFKATRAMQLHTLSIPKAFGGLASDKPDPKTSGVLYEEFGYGDIGLTISMGGSSPFRLAAASQDPKLHQVVKDYVNDTEADMIGCWAIT